MLTLFASSTGTVDRESSVIRGVSVITKGEARGHGVVVDDVTLSQVLGCMSAFGDGGVRVKLNHYSGFEAIIGTVRNARIDGDKVVADLHLLPTHPLFGHVMGIAETQPHTFGLSISFSGKADVSGSVKLARCSELYSIDLVDRPAANPAGLFEQGQSMDLGTIKDAMLEALGVKTKTDELQSKLTEFEVSHAKLTQDLSEATAKVTEFQAAIAKHEAEVTELKAKVDAAEAAQKDFDAKVETAASAKALEIAQRQGVRAVTFSVQDGNTKTELTGQARVVAALKAQAEQKKG